MIVMSTEYGPLGDGRSMKLSESITLRGTPECRALIRSLRRQSQGRWNSLAGESARPPGGRESRSGCGSRARHSGRQGEDD